MQNARLKAMGSGLRRVMRYGAELVVVFIGVWLSLLAENWRQDRIDSGNERYSLTRMTEDLASDLVDLKVNLNRAQAGVTYGRSLLAHDAATHGPTDSLARALSAIQFCSVFVENTGEYEALRNSGQLRIISDANLRRRIVALYESRRLIRSLHEKDCQINEATFNLVAPHVLVSEPPEASLGQAAADGFVDSSRPRVTSVPGRQALFQDRAFLAHLTELVAMRRFLVDQVISQTEATGSLRDELLTRISIR